MFITILFMLPTGEPDHWDNFNYTVVAVVAVLGFAGIYWLVSARNWFTGPEGPGHAEELAAIEQELSTADGRAGRAGRDAARPADAGAAPAAVATARSTP